MTMTIDNMTVLGSIVLKYTVTRVHRLVSRIFSIQRKEVTVITVSRYSVFNIVDQSNSLHNTFAE